MENEGFPDSCFYNSLIMKEEQDSIVDQVEQYVKTTTELYTLKITEKVSTVVASVFSKLIIGSFVFVVIFMLTMGLSFWVGELMGHIYLGFLIVGGTVGLITLIMYVRRNIMIKKPIMDSIISQLLK